MVNSGFIYVYWFQKATELPSVGKMRIPHTTKNTVVAAVSDEDNNLYRDKTYFFGQNVSLHEISRKNDIAEVSNCIDHIDGMLLV